MRIRGDARGLVRVVEDPPYALLKPAAELEPGLVARGRLALGRLAHIARHEMHPRLERGRDVPVPHADVKDDRAARKGPPAREGGPAGSERS